MMKSRINKTGLETPGLYFAQMGNGMSYQCKFEVMNKMNGLVLGTPGKSTKSTTFKKEEFKKDLAPKRAKIEKFSIDGQDYIRMTY